MSHKCFICYKNDLPDGQFYHARCCKRVFGDELAPEVLYTLDDIKDLARKIIQSQHGITGVQPKISVGIERSLNRQGRLTLMTGDFILKPPTKQYSQMPENEDLTMHLAEVAQIKTVSHALIPLASGELAYISKRMDRTSKGKIHMEDFCQLSGLLTEDKYRSSMERAGKIINKFSTFPMLDLITVFELTLFCFVTGNNDMHLKNFSLIDQGAINLAPAYDLLNVNLLLPSDNEETALQVNGRKTNLKRQDFEILASSYGLENDQLIRTINSLLSKANELSSRIDESFLNDENKELYKKLIKGRLERLSQ
jgi:serine/threonine-protein kinase HipA